MERIAAQRDELRKQFFADQRAAALLAQETAAFLGRARLEGECHQRHQIADRGRLQDHGVLAGVELDGILPLETLLHGGLADGGAGDVIDAHGGVRGPSGTGAFGIAHGGGEVRVGVAAKAEVACLVGDRVVSGVAFEVAGGHQALGFGGVDDRLHVRHHHGIARARGGIDPVIGGAVLLRAQRRNALGVGGREVGELLGGVNGVANGLLVKFIHARAAGLVILGDGNRHRLLGHEAAGGHAVQREADEGVLRAGEVDAALGEAGERDGLFREFLELIFGEHGGLSRSG